MQRVFLKKEPNLLAKHEAFPFQAEASQAIRDLDYAAVFHEQGLGKTKIAIDVVLYWLEKKLIDAVLVVVKKALLANWQRELALHTHIKPRLLSQDRRANFFVFNSPARVILAHYEVIQSERERMALFLKTRSVAAVLDESAKIKNPGSSITRTFFELAPLFAKRLILTGTPVANRPYDIWSQVWFLDQGASLGNDFAQFKRDVDMTSSLSNDPQAQEQFENSVQGIFRRIRHFSVRERKSSGLIELPQKIVTRVRAEWEHYQFDLYRQIRDDLRAVVVKDGIPSEDKSEEFLKRLMRLVQVASNPRLVDDSYNAEPGKLPPVKDLVRSICERGEKCIIWTSFTENADCLAQEFRPSGARRVHGKLPLEQRNRSIERFLTDPECKVLIATPGAAKEGLTLTVANHVIFYDRSFSLDDYLQAQDRIHRISQTKTCFVYNIIMAGSIDEWVDVLLHAKQLAAQLAQGDISHDYYRSQMSYDFAEVLGDVLGISHTGGNG